MAPPEVSQGHTRTKAPRRSHTEGDRANRNQRDPEREPGVPERARGTRESEGKTSSPGKSHGGMGRARDDPEENYQR